MSFGNDAPSATTPLNGTLSEEPPPYPDPINVVEDGNHRVHGGGA